MLARLGVTLAFFGIGLTLWFQGNDIFGVVLFGLSAFCVVEAVLMCSYYRFWGVQIANADKARFIDSEDTPSVKMLTIPISLRFPFYEIKDFRVRVVSDKLSTSGEVYNDLGQTLGGSLGDVFTLNRTRRQGFISIAYLTGGSVMISNPPVQHRPLGGIGKYRINVEIRGEDKLLISRCYTLAYNGGELTMLDAV